MYRTSYLCRAVIARWLGYFNGDFMLSIFTNISDVSIKHKSLSIKGMTYITRKQNPPAWTKRIQKIHSVVCQQTYSFTLSGTIYYLLMGAVWRNKKWLQVHHWGWFTGTMLKYNQNCSFFVIKNKWVLIEF